MFNISANTNLILWETERAFLLKLPKTKFKFWISKKLVRVYENQITFLIPDNFEVKVFKNGEGKWNSREIIEEKILNRIEFLEHFGWNFNNDIIEDLRDD